MLRYTDFVLRFVVLCLLIPTASAGMQSVETLVRQLEAATTDPGRMEILAAHPEQRAEVLSLVGKEASERYGKSDPGRAIKLYQVLLAVALDAGDDAKAADLYLKVSVCLREKAEMAASLAAVEQAQKLALKANNKVTLANAKNQIMVVYLGLGRFDEAERAGEEALETFKALGDVRRSIAVRINLATVLGEKGDHAAKASMLRQTIRECEEHGYNDYLVFSLNNLAVVYFDQGDYARCIDYFQRTADIQSKKNTPDKATLLFINSNLGVAYQFLGREKEALERYEQAVRDFGNGETAQLMHMRHNRADLYRVMGRIDEALSEARIVAAFFEKAGMVPETVRAQGIVSRALLDLGRKEESVAVAEVACKGARTLGNPEALRGAALVLGEGYISIGQREKARAAFLESIEAIEAVRLGGGEDERESFFHTKVLPYQGMVQVLMEDGKQFEALQYAERAKARLLLDVLRGGRTEITNAMTSEEKQRERQLTSAVAKLDTRLAKGTSVANMTPMFERNKAANELDTFRQGLYERHPGLRTQRAEFRPIQLDQLAELAPDRETALLEYAVTEDKAYLFVVTTDAKGEARLNSYVLADPKGLAAQIEKFRNQLSGRDLQYRAPAAALYKRLLGPAAVPLRGRKRLVIVPDGALWSLPFQALLSEQGRYLIEDAAVFYVPSLTAAREMLHLKRSGEEGGRTVLAMGGPTTTGKLPPLPESIREVREVGQVYGAKASAVYVEGQASKQRWKTEAPRYRVLHLATHGILDSNNPLYSHLVMSQVPGDPEESVLTAREILDMDLRADLTVLSACEMARGRFRFGEGLIGTSWAFLVAGTPTTVVSQWKVDSASTRELMVAFHRNLKPASTGALTKRSEALRGAVLQLLRSSEYRHPFYWAGFVMIGNGY